MSKITKIEINEDCSIVTSDKINLIGLIITTKNMFGKTKTHKVFPTRIGRIQNDNGILFHYFCDELGKELSNEISYQLNNYCFTQEQLLKFE